jgi:hypothetical protein
MPLLILALPLLFSERKASTASAPSVKVPPSLPVPCAQGVQLPQRDLAADEVERYWLQDRLALRECRTRHGGLAAAVTATP